MLATFILASSSLLLGALITETIFMVFLLLLLARVFIVALRRTDQRNRARRERDEAKEVVDVLRRMSEIRMETVTRIKGFPQ